MAIAIAQAGHACSVPVFRYALEHWPSDPFELIVFHQGHLTPAQESDLSALEAIDPTKPANITTTRVDLASEPNDEWKTLAAMITGKPLPHLMLRFPRSSGRPQPILTLSLAEAKTRPALWDSPARETIADRIGQGESAVWVMIESGDKARDDATAALIEARLEYLMSVLSLPKLDELDIANGLVSIPESDLRLDFTLLRVSRTDPAEQTFLTLLLKTETGLDKVRAPIVIPVFGRGRALYALVGDGIRPETIEQAATFLIGKCSCQVKEKNPGTDLLFATDWGALIKAGALTDRELPSLADLTKNIPITTHPTATPSADPPRPLWPWLILPLMLLIPARRFFRKPQP